jgi:serine/threonine-protein kinase RsbW
MPTTSRRFCASMSALSELLDCARAACVQAHLEQQAIRRIELALEELFTNTVRHGYGRDCESPVWLQASDSPQALRIVYQDAAPAFDPLQHETQLDAAGRERTPGGLGLHLARCLADAIAYQRVGDRNVVTLTFAHGGRAAVSTQTDRT